MSGDLLFVVEIQPERISDALHEQGFHVEVLLPESNGPLPRDVLRVRRGLFNGLIHATGIEAVALEHVKNMLAKARSRSRPDRSDRSCSLAVPARDDHARRMPPSP